MTEMEFTESVLVDPRNWESWLAKIYIQRNNSIYVPKHIIKILNLKNQDFVEVAIRKEEKMK